MSQKRARWATRRSECSRPENVTAVKREFGLKQSGLGHAGQTDEWIVCRHDDALKPNPVAVGLDAALFGIELAGRCLFKNMRAVSRNRLDQFGEIFSRMKFRLIGKAHARQIVVRD